MLSRFTPHACFELQIHIHVVIYPANKSVSWLNTKQQELVFDQLDNSNLIVGYSTSFNHLKALRSRFKKTNATLTDQVQLTTRKP